MEVEILNDPSLRGKPLIVGGTRERGVVTSCSYEARRFGVQSAMPMKKALQICPQATVVPGARGQYGRFSRWVTQIISDRAPIFEKASIDEFYIDLTGMDRFHDPLSWTIALRKEITAQTGLPISFGLASNKMVAKIATNEAKPNGYLHVLAGKEKEFLAPLSVGSIPGVGSKTLQDLQTLGIETIGDLAAYPVGLLTHTLGKWGAALHRKAFGFHDGEVQTYHAAKSISTEHTFQEDIGDMDFLCRELASMTEKVASQLREQNKMAGCLTVRIRYPDFETTSRQTTVPYTFYDDELIPVARDLFLKLHKPGQKVRLIGVRLSELTDGALQTNLFTDANRKFCLYRSIDAVRERFGKSAITRGGTLHD